MMKWLECSFLTAEAWVHFSNLTSQMTGLSLLLILVIAWRVFFKGSQLFLQFNKEHWTKGHLRKSRF